MCVDHRVICKCATNSVSFNFRDNVMPENVIRALYCPRCSSDLAFDPESMVRDNTWVIDYDMEVAEFMKPKLPAARITPEFIFDKGYATWRGVYPGDEVDSAREREEIVKLAKTDPKRYFTEFKTWAVTRMERLKSEGWRKANEA